MASGELIRSQGEEPGQETEAQGPRVRGEALQGGVGEGIAGEGTGQGTGPPLKRKKEDEQRRKRSRERKGNWGSWTHPRQESGELRKVGGPRGEESPWVWRKEEKAFPAPGPHLARRRR